MDDCCGCCGSAAKGVREGLVLMFDGSGGLRGGKVGTFKIGSGEVGDTVSDGSSDFGEGFLDLGWVVVSFWFVGSGYPMRKCD